MSIDTEHIALDPHASIPASGPFAGHLHFDASVTPVLRTAADVDAYVRRDLARLPVDAAQVRSDGSLPAPLRLALGVLQRLEGGALSESRAMLATATGDEARITAFLATWHVERLWQARALRDVLTAEHSPDTVGNGGRRGPGGTRPTRRPSPHARLRRAHADRIQPLLSPLWSLLAGEAVAAGHMARMAIQEASAQVALRALAPRLPAEAQRVVREVAARHDAAVEFFTLEAQARIRRSAKEAGTARLVLALGSPLAPGGVPDPDLAAALRVIGAEAGDRAALHRARFEITRLLPGPVLPDPHLLALTRAATPAAPAPHRRGG